MRLRLSLLALAFASAAALPACTESAYVRATWVPARIEAYPHTYYGGRTVFLVNGRWYTRDRGRWVYYRREPEPLYRVRTRSNVQRAPAAHPRDRRWDDDRRRLAPASREQAPPARPAVPRARRVD